MALDFSGGLLKPPRWGLSTGLSAAPGLWRGCTLLHDLRSATVAIDVSRARRDGEIFGAPASTPAGLEFFNATRSRIVTDVAGVATVQNTVAIRAQVDDPSRLQWLFGRYTGDGNGQSLWVASADVRLGSWNGHGSSGVTLAPGQWYDIILTSRQASGTTSDLRLYIDGEFRYERLGSQFDHSSPPSDFVVGMDRANDLRDSLHLRGEVAIYALWSRVLSDGEIAAWSRDPFVMLRPSRALIPTLYSEEATGPDRSLSLAATEGADTFAASAIHYAEASLAATEGADTFAATAIHYAETSLAATEGADTFAATLGVFGSLSLAATEGADAFSASVIVEPGLDRTLSLAATEGADTFAAVIIDPQPSDPDALIRGLWPESVTISATWDEVAISGRWPDPQQVRGLFR